MRWKFCRLRNLAKKKGGKLNGITDRLISRQWTVAEGERFYFVVLFHFVFEDVATWRVTHDPRDGPTPIWL